MRAARAGERRVGWTAREIEAVRGFVAAAALAARHAQLVVAHVAVGTAAVTRARAAQLAANVGAGRAHQRAAVGVAAARQAQLIIERDALAPDREPVARVATKGHARRRLAQHTA